MKTKCLDKVLSRHADTCAYWTFSGDRHCSCGRDKAVEELEEIKKKAEAWDAHQNQLGQLDQVSQLAPANQ